MERTAVRGRLTWQLARVVELVTENARTKSIVLDAADWPDHLAGQHVDVRLTAEDGYQAQRSYSIASAPEDEHLVLTVERLDDGEVSPYLTETLRPGDELELRGPIGGYFVWQESLGGPLLLVGGGSGVVPLRAMLRHHRAVASDVPARLLYSARTRDDLIYREELGGLRHDDHADARAAARAGRATPAASAPSCSRRSPGRRRERPLVYVCGPTGFVEGVCRRARRARPRARPDQDGEVRPDMSIGRSPSTATRSPATSLEVFGVELTAATGVCAACGASAPSPRRSSTCAARGASRAAARAATVLHRARDDPRHHLRRPARDRRTPDGTLTMTWERSRRGLDEFSSHDPGVTPSS